MICIDGMFTGHEQAFVCYDLETVWDDSEAFTVEVGVPLKGTAVISFAIVMLLSAT